MAISRMAKGFLPYSLEQHLLLPPDMRSWLDDGHLALFVSDVVDQLDLSAIFAAYPKDDDRGRAGYHPTMMVKLRVHGYAIGVTSSRKLEKKTTEDVAFRIMPDGANKGSFVQGHNAQIAVDGHAQIIVAALVTQTPNDKQQLEPMAELVAKNVGRLADVTSADAGYFAELPLERVATMGTELLVPPGRQKHRESPLIAMPEPDASAAERMRYKFQGKAGKAL